MKHLKAVAVPLVLLTLATGAMLLQTGKSAASRTKSGTSPARIVVELFTSEGCSSCPPADILLAKLSARPWAENVEVLALEEHVDYWDQLGWKDPFSSPESTQRQENYAARFANGSVYTPQMVVNGRTEFVGSREGEARRVIEEATGKAETEVIVTSEKSTGDKERLMLRVGKVVDASPDDIPEVWLAVTETGLHSEVTRGENAGEDLHHAAVVRMLRKIGIANEKDGKTSFTGEASVSLDRGWKRDNLRAVVFVQEKKSRQIVGAAETKLTP